MLVLLGRVPGAGGADRLAARSAATRLAALGVHLADGSPVLPGEGATAPVRVRVLGRFEVLVGGRPVPLPAWKSRQARTLVKILVARRGRPVPRTELCELLWPDDEPHRTAHRLSVLLSVVRQVLDPAKRWPADHYVGADLAGLSLNLSRVTVDVEDLLRDAAHGVRLARDGDPARARDLLTDVDTAYRGDAFDDEPYEDWADGLREQARAGWLRALRELAAVCRRTGDLDHAASCLVRLLAADGYDEAAHRTLVEVMVAAGRHGEARRAFDRWTAAMRSIEVPDPDRAVLHRGA
jgi:DNA-binding SARP family transcriptional activator